jgi:hypothetical protein
MWTIVHFAWEGDGEAALYDPSGVLVTRGDQYHDKISDWLEGYLAAVKRFAPSMRSRDLYVSDEEFEFGFDAAPETLEEVFATYTARYSND